MKKILDISKAISCRQSWRSYEKRPVDRKIINQILSLAFLAPTPCNLQTIEAVVVDDPRLTKKFADSVSQKFSWGRSYIILMYDKRFAIKRHAGIISLGAVMQNILLLAPKYQLATCPITGFNHDTFLKDTLKIPDWLEIGLVIAIGYPEYRTRKNKLKLPPCSFRHYNRYSQSRHKINASVDLNSWTIADIINYRRRIAPTYLYNNYLHLNVYDDCVYLDALKNLLDCNVAKDTSKILDLVTYDGTFVSALAKSLPETRITVSDYFLFPLKIIKNNNPSVTITKLSEKSTVTLPAIYDLVTFVHKAEFIPDFNRLLATAFSRLTPGGYCYLTTYCPSALSKIKNRINRYYLSIIKRETVNVYENNPHYKIGPFLARNPVSINLTGEAIGYRLIKSGYRKIGNHRYFFALFQTPLIPGAKPSTNSTGTPDLT